MKVKDKVIIVTGGGSGMGRELVLKLIEKGAKVAAVDINEKTLEDTLNLIADDKKERISTHVVNIADKDAVEALPNAVIEKHGVVDGIINNAGIIQPFVKVNDIQYDVVERVFNVNFWGTLYMIKSFLPHLLKRPEGHVLNVSSMGGFLPVPGQGIYGATKAAVKLLTESLQSELAFTNVKVSVVFPGAINTNIMSNSGVKMSVDNNKEAENSKLKPLDANIAAGMIIDGMEKDKIRIYVGKDSKMMNNMYRFSPKYATGLITKKMKSLLS